MKRPVYLDYAATTPVDPRVAAAMAQCLGADGEFGNPGSESHEFGAAAAALVEKARARVAACAGASPDEVVWTSGATEANNLAIFGVARYYREEGRHIVTALTEHKAVLDPCRELERRGWRVTYLAPDRGGIIHPDQVAAALRADTVLVSIMHVNNEIGVVQDIAAIAAVCARHGSARLHVDAAQSIGKSPLDFAACGADLMSLSAHKVYGPKGAGALLVSRRGRAPVHLTALQFGGGQERALRAGTVATHQVVGMGLALELARTESPSECERIAAMRERLWQGLASLGGIHRNGDPARTVPHLLNVSIEGVEGESLLAAVRGRLAVSTGSACNSASRAPSYVLRALGRDPVLSESSLRFGLGRFTCEDDIDAAVSVVTQATSRLRRISGQCADPSAEVLTGPDVFRGSAGGRESGAWVQFDVRVNSGVIEAARFLAFGCPHTIAAAAWVAEHGVGPVQAALPESVEDLSGRFAVPVEKRGRLLIVEDAWVAAVAGALQR